MVRFGNKSRLVYVRYTVCESKNKTGMGGNARPRKAGRREERQGHLHEAQVRRGSCGKGEHSWPGVTIVMKETQKRESKGEQN